MGVKDWHAGQATMALEGERGMSVNWHTHRAYSAQRRAVNRRGLSAKRMGMLADWPSTLLDSPCGKVNMVAKIDPSQHKRDRWT